MTNGECSGLIHEFEYYPEAMETSLPTNPSIVYNLLVEQDLPVETIVSTACCVYENVSATNSVDNLTATYSNGITTLSWDYPDSTPMNHTIVLYSHSAQATAENWDSFVEDSYQQFDKFWNHNIRDKPFRKQCRERNFLHCNTAL